MSATIQKWGNSLAIRIPKATADQANLIEGTPIEIVAEGGRIVLSPIRRPYRLEEMLAAVTDKNRHDEVDLGPPVGREKL